MSSITDLLGAGPVMGEPDLAAGPLGSPELDRIRLVLLGDNLVEDKSPQIDPWGVFASY
jgi:hypothetical protein